MTAKQNTSGVSPPEINRPRHSLSPVFHVGDLSSERTKPHYSFEGRGLSISKTPNAWRHIARLSGDTYRLNRSAGTFYVVDESDPQADQYAAAERDWCIEADFVTPETVYRVEWETADGDTRYSLFYDAETAQKEANGLENGSVTPTDGVALDTNGEQYWKSAFTESVENASPMGVEQLLPVWVAMQLDVDGVWWNYEYAPHDLSAPCGVIFQDNLEEWETTNLGSPSTTHIEDSLEDRY